jgi:hypothetical protein
VRIIDFDDFVANELERLRYETQRRWLPWAGAAFAALALVTALLERNLWGLVLAFLGAAAVCMGLWGYFELRYRKAAVARSQLKAGLDGQQIVPQALAHLSDQYYLLNNVPLPNRHDDVDHILLGPNGIFAIEAKHHRGVIRLREGEWYQSKLSQSGRPQPESPIRDPIQQIKRNVGYLRTCINHTDPALSRRTRLWIEGLVVFTHRSAELDLPGAPSTYEPVPVLRARDLPAHIEAHRPRHQLPQRDRLRIIEMLAHLQAPLQ